MRITEATGSSGSSSFTTVFKVIARALSVGIRPVWFVMEASLNGYERWRQRQALMRLDDHLLKDIGVSRADVDSEVSKPFWRG
ncbi:DUF1127 domain-containing protein [Azospirillum argentinense]|uniref:DUF1127 domain-containing protein n=1 Tax=Azospirillum brasilense TaxID=192 RepID=A0A4D8Q276_AZOBR|nr:DUF1127 domain-containing protein [Azospirillum argentinense]QCO01160.1 DUF1127 domain-containing protein [Azospirillum argentinense]